MTTPWVVVLGASSGIGAATARAFARRGHPILGVHLDLRASLPAARQVQADVEACGVEARFVNGNAADPARVTEALGALPAGATVGVLVHSLAFGSLKPLVGEGAAGVRELHMTLDVMAHSLVTWAQALDGRWAPDARVFALTSSGSLVALPSYGPVSAAKAALEAHVRQLAVELAPRVKVNAVMAGLCETPALRRIPGWEALRDRARAANPSGRLTTPEDVADALVALAAPGLAWMTGAVVRVDGGESIAG